MQYQQQLQLHQEQQQQQQQEQLQQELQQNTSSWLVAATCAKDLTIIYEIYSDPSQSEKIRQSH